MLETKPENWWLKSMEDVNIFWIIRKEFEYWGQHLLCKDVLSPAYYDGYVEPISEFSDFYQSLVSACNGKAISVSQGITQGRILSNEVVSTNELYKVYW